MGVAFTLANTYNAQPEPIKGENYLIRCSIKSKVYILCTLFYSVSEHGVSTNTILALNKVIFDIILQEAPLTVK